MRTEQISENQINFINNLMEDSNDTALSVGGFLIEKGISNLNRGQASYLINILKKYNKELPAKKENTKQKQEGLKTGTIKIENSYSGHGWKGVNYDLAQDTKEIAKLMRKELKRLYPACKFSITTEYNHVKIHLMSSNKSPFETENNIDWDRVHHGYRVDYGTTLEELKRDCYQYYIDNGHMQLNNYHLENDWRISEDTKTMFKTIRDLLNSFNMDDSDSYTDYFHTRFYTDLGIGKYNKKFEIK